MAHVSNLWRLGSAAEQETASSKGETSVMSSSSILERPESETGGSIADKTYHVTSSRAHEAAVLQHVKRSKDLSSPIPRLVSKQFLVTERSSITSAV